MKLKLKNLKYEVTGREGPHLKLRDPHTMEVFVLPNGVETAATAKYKFIKGKKK